MAQRVDFTTITPTGPKADGSRQTPLRWWLEQGPQTVEGITATLKAMEGRQSARVLQQAIAARLYGNVSVLGVQTQGQPRSVSPLLKDKITYNAVQSAIDTIVSKIAKNKPKPLFLTSGGDYRMQRKAKKLNQFVDGVFYENDAYKLGVECFRAGAVGGDGIIHVFPHNGRVKYETVLSTELWVDEFDGFYGEPRQMHRKRRMDKAVLLELAKAWTKDQGLDEEAQQVVLGKVRDARTAPLDGSGNGDVVADLVEVRESWHLPDGPEATKKDPKNGLHVISIEGCELLREPYLHDFFPFARFRWAPRLFGYWSQGGAEQVQNLQLEINKLLWIIQRSFHLAGTYKVFVENASKVVNEKLNNDIGAIIRYTGAKPEYVVPQIVPPEIFQHLLTLKAAVYEQLGISQLSANAQKPAGLNSGKALREFNDIESDRFQVIGQEYERLFMDLARISIAVIKDIAGERGSYKVRVPGPRKRLDILDWKDVRLDEDDYILQAFPVSSLPNEPAGRLETIQEWVQAGWITPRQGRRLMDFPDLEMAEGLANAAEDYLTLILEQMTDGGDYVPPEPYDDLELGTELALEYYQRGKVQGLEEENLEKLRRFLDQIQAIKQSAAANQAMQAAAGAPTPGQPQAAPEPPPTSGLIPNQPGMLGAPGAQAAA